MRATWRLLVLALVIVVGGARDARGQFTWTQISESMSSYSYVKWGINDDPNWMYGYGHESINQDSNDTDTSPSSHVVDTEAWTGGYPPNGPNFAWSRDLRLEFSGDGTDTIGLHSYNRAKERVTTYEIPDLPDFDPEVQFATVWQELNGEAVFQLDGSGNAAITGTLDIQGLSTTNIYSGTVVEMTLAVSIGSNPDMSGYPQTWTPFVSGGSTLASVDVFAFDYFFWDMDEYGPFINSTSSYDPWPEGNWDYEIPISFATNDIPDGTYVKFEYFLRLIHDTEIGIDYHTGDLCAQFWVDLDVTAN